MFNNHRPTLPQTVTRFSRHCRPLLYNLREVTQGRVGFELPLAARQQAEATRPQRRQHYGRTAHGISSRTDCLPSGNGLYTIEGSL